MWFSRGGPGQRAPVKLEIGAAGRLEGTTGEPRVKMENTLNSDTEDTFKRQ